VTERDDAVVPPIAHFVFGLREQDEPFHLVHYLAIASCLEVLQPESVIVHCDQLPYGIYWDLIRPRVTLKRVRPHPHVATVDHRAGLARYLYAHHADIVRLDVLLEHGGIYADIDTLFVVPPPPACLRASTAIGREADIVDERTGRARPSLSNAVLFAEPGAPFVSAWRDRIESAMDGSWSAHSCLLAHDLAAERPELVHVEPQRTFHHFAPSPEGLGDLLVGDVDDLERVSAVHLCAHLWWSEARRDFSPVHAATIDEPWVRAGSSTYARLARPFLPEHGLF
jgi:hypothetical protein